MTQGRHHRRRDDDHTVDGIYVPPPREVPRPRTEPTDWPPPAPPPAAAPPPWAPAAPGGAPPAQPPDRPDGHPAAQPGQPPTDHARSSEWAGRSSSPWAPADDEHDEEDPYASAEDPPPAPPAHAVAEGGGDQWLPPLYPQEWPPEPVRQEWTPLPLPEDRRADIPSQRRVGPLGASAVPRPQHAHERSSATAWWIAVGVIIVALAVAAGVLVGLRLAARAGQEPNGAAEATCGWREVQRTAVAPEPASAVEQAAGGCGLVAVTS
ncbi:hypothetical protein [Dactylosporangium sp. NPDC048998]|uniref:hypothetical protein n=1 Tax=Dactylosporangium sp. NPDC048998 TaxID=3363976 RepID=UPI003715BE9F